MEQIILNNDVTIYKTKYISPYPLDDTLERIKTNVQLNKKTTDDRIHENVGPGIQSSLIVKCPELDVILDRAVSLCKDLYNEKTIGYLIHSWIAISRNDRGTTLWHKHINFASPNNFIKTDYTFTYYLQMPDNLYGDDGMILFKTNDGQIHKFLPEENDMFIFPPDLEHVVGWNRESTKDRVVVASNITFINSNKNTIQCIQKIL